MVVFILSVLDWKYPFWINLVQKKKNSHFMLKSDTLSINTSMVMLFFLFLTGSILFLDLLQKSKLFVETEI